MGIDYSVYNKVDSFLYNIVRSNSDLKYLLEDDYDKEYIIFQNLKSKKLNLLQKLILISNRYVIFEYLSNFIYLYKDQINYQNEIGWTSLMIASSNQNKHSNYLVNLLLKYKANPNIQDINGCSALMMACICSNTYIDIKTIKLILKKSDPNIQDCNGWTSLMIVCSNSNIYSIDLVKLLLKNGSDPNIQDNNGCNSLMISCMYSNTLSNNETVRLLLENGANPDLQNNDGWTALMLSCRYINTTSNNETVKLLLEYNSDVKLFNYDFNSNALMILCEHNHYQYNLAKILKEKSDLTHRNINNKTINKICLPEYKKLFKKSIIDVINNNEIVYSQCEVCSNKNIKCIQCKFYHHMCLYCLKNYSLKCFKCNIYFE